MEHSSTAEERSIQSNFAVKGFRISNVCLRPEEQIGSHSQATWELSLVVKGHGRRIIGASEEAFSNGDLVLVPPQVEHCWRFEPCGMERNITLEINPSWMESLPTVLPEIGHDVERILAMESIAMTFTPCVRTEIAKMLRRMIHCDRIEQFALLLRIIQLIAQEGNAEAITGAERRINIDERRKERLRIFVECNYRSRVSLATVAQHIGMSRTSFCRWFRENYHTTFVAYLQTVRLERMATLLSDPTLTVREACYQSGFADTAYATRLFHAHFGLTPRAYRDRNGD